MVADLLRASPPVEATYHRLARAATPKSACSLIQINDEQPSSDNFINVGKSGRLPAPRYLPLDLVAAKRWVDMVQVIDQLGRDHRNLRLLLDIVEEETDAYREGGVPDFDLLRLIAEYTLHYPDLVHHPKEDLVFERLVMRNPAAGAVIGDLVEEHRRLGELSRRFAAAISNAARDVELPREWLDSLAREYLSVNRLHMQLEEEHFLPRAMAMLTEEDWAAIDERLSHANDPVFGEKVAQAYLYLHERILRLYG
jgi:hemerythrin-like domain-containing protein